MDLSQEERERSLDQLREVEAAFVPIGPGGDEALPLVDHPGRGEGLGRHHEHQLLRPAEPDLELPDPGATAAEIGRIEEDFLGPARVRESGLEVLLENLDPRPVAVGIAQEGRVALGHVGKIIALVRRLGDGRSNGYLTLVKQDAHAPEQPPWPLPAPRSPALE